MKEILQKYHRFTDPDFSNAELKFAVNHYTLLCDLLGEHGKLYELVWKDANKMLQFFEGMLTARKTE